MNQPLQHFSADSLHEWIINVFGRANAFVHAQHMEMCMQLGKCDTPKFLSQMNSDLPENWYKHELGIKDAPRIF